MNNFFGKQLLKSSKSDFFGSLELIGTNLVLFARIKTGYCHFQKFQFHKEKIKYLHTYLLISNVLLGFINCLYSLVFCILNCLFVLSVCCSLSPYTKNRTPCPSQMFRNEVLNVGSAFCPPKIHVCTGDYLFNRQIKYIFIGHLLGPGNTEANKTENNSCSSWDIVLIGILKSLLSRNYLNKKAIVMCHF